MSKYEEIARIWIKIDQYELFLYIFDVKTAYFLISGAPSPFIPSSVVTVIHNIPNPFFSEENVVSLGVI